MVSAGCKAILDLPRTLEMLETLAVPVLGVRTNEFPAFYTYSSGLPLEHRVDDAIEAARASAARTGRSAAPACSSPIRSRARTRSTRRRSSAPSRMRWPMRRAPGIRGKALTPHLLAFVSRVTQKRSLAANRVLALANATFGAELASALAGCLSPL